MRRSYLVCYDIRNPKRLHKVGRIMKGYGERWQYSVFFCMLKNIDLVRLKNALQEAINTKEDQVLIIDMGRGEDAARNSTTIIGQSLLIQNNRVVVI